MDVTLVAEKRADKGKNQARRHRAAGRLPAVVYGPGSGGLTVITGEHVAPGVGNERFTDHVGLAHHPAHAAVVVEHGERRDVQLREDLGGTLDGGLGACRGGLTGHDFLDQHDGSPPSWVRGMTPA